MYTIPSADESKRFDLEYFYADKIDSILPSVYNQLKEPSINDIDFELRLKVISTTLGLYFRTPKFLKAENNLFENLVKKTLSDNDQEIISVKYLGKDIDIKHYHQLSKMYYDLRKVDLKKQNQEMHALIMQHRINGLLGNDPF